DVRRELAQVVVAGADLDPGVGDPDDRLAQRLVVEADRLEHGAGGGAMRAFDDGGAGAPVDGHETHAIRPVGPGRPRGSSSSGTTRACASSARIPPDGRAPAPRAGRTARWG